MGFLSGIISKFIGSPDEREIKKIEPMVDQVFALEAEMEGLSDDELRGKTEEFKKRLAEGESLDDLLPEAYAVVREASWRVLGMKQYRVQVIGGIILHQGRIAEMKTGEGKTLVATLPAYLNALEGKGVHVVTVNDYLAHRDMEWMGKVYEFLGLKVGVIIHGLSNDERRENYQADITYGTNNQFGFDYLRDNMVVYKEEMVQRDLHFAIVDEVDSILVDEARTPLIISGEGEDSSIMYVQADNFVRTLSKRLIDPDEDKGRDPFDREIKEETVDVVVDEKRKSSNLTELGTAKAEKYFGVENLSDPEHMQLVHHINQALKANNNMHRDINYVVRDGEVMIVDEFTGRIMEGRRYSEGLHQAIEAKERVEVKSESKTLATITFQNYFRMYGKLSGMTGTAKTEEDEFREIYNMDVIEIPTNVPVQRQDLEDEVYLNENAKNHAIIDEIVRAHETGQPVLVGTISIEDSEHLSSLLKRRGVAHEVLNAKYHEREAEIVAQAGKLGSVTIATNMAGRGTDIVLGGNPEASAKHQLKKEGYSEEAIEKADSLTPSQDEETLEIRNRMAELVAEYKKDMDINKEKVLETGGLYIIGTERHESRRIDNQLRGRAGRQGDPGASKFFISLEDDLMRLFGGEAIQNFAGSDMYPEDEPLSARLLTGAIERAQRRVEANNFSARKYVLEYDNVMNLQRQIIYKERKSVLDGEDMKEKIQAMIRDIVDEAVATFCQSADPQEWEMEGFMNYLASIYLPRGVLKIVNLSDFNQESFADYVYEESIKLYQAKEDEVGAENFREVERVILLRVVDSKWMDHIDAMDQLRQGIGLRSYGQQNPVRAYEQEGFEMFEEMNHSIREDTVRMLYSIERPERIEREKVAKNVSESGGGEPAPAQEPVVKGERVGRNDPCPCGSGKKYKRCCGRE